MQVLFSLVDSTSTQCCSVACLCGATFLNGNETVNGVAGVATARALGIMTTGTGFRYACVYVMYV